MWWRRSRKPAGGAPKGTLACTVNRTTGLRRAEIAVYEDRLVLLGDTEGRERDTTPRTYAWQDVAHVWSANDMEIDAAEDQGRVDNSSAEVGEDDDLPFPMVHIRWTHRLMLQFADDTVARATMMDPPVTRPEFLIHVGGNLNLPTSPLAPLVDHLCRKVVDAQLPAAEAALANGGEVTRGPLTATPEGLRHEGTDIPWAAITSLRNTFMYAAETEADLGSLLRIDYQDTQGRTPDTFPLGHPPTRRLRIPAFDIPDLELLLRLSTPRLP